MESNLNRSFSAPDISSEPICRRVFMEEFYYSNSSPYPIRRQISYDQFPPQFSGQDIHSKFLPIDHKSREKQFLKYPNYTPNKISSKPKLLEEPQQNEPIPDHFNDSPMDIDMEDLQIQERSKPRHTIATSTPTIKTEPGLEDCKISYRAGKPVLIKDQECMISKEIVDAKEEMAKFASEGLKKKFRRLTGDKKSSIEEIPKKASLKIPLIATLIIALGLVPVYDHYNYNRTIDLERIKMDLRENVINQNRQIEQITEFLERINSDKNKHVLTFIGTTGVGKTHCANFIKRAFKAQQIYEINLQDFNLKNLQLHRDLPYLLILENLKISDVDRVILFLDALPINKSLLILNIFNIQETEDHKEYVTHSEYLTEIPKLFENTGYSIEAVKFNGFHASVVKGYYDFLTRDNGVDKDLFFRTIEEHNFEYFGLKKFFAKLNLA